MPLTKSPRFFGLLRSPKLVLIRRVVGVSMSPKLHPGQLLLATPLFRRLHPGQVVIIDHEGKQKVKRIERIDVDKVFVIGDNLQASTDSRHFGWIQPSQIIARVIWPNVTK
jgi:nickel-type superoxide dismutase maturation protease